MGLNFHFRIAKMHKLMSFKCFFFLSQLHIDYEAENRIPNKKIV